MFPVTTVRIIYRAATKWSENGGTRLGAALAYYALFSIGPLLLITVHIVGAIYHGEREVRLAVHNQLMNLLGNDSTVATVEQLMGNTGQLSASGWSPAVSAGMLLVTAIGSFLYLRSTLCAIWKLEPPHGNTWLALLWDYVLAVALMLVIALLLLFSIMCSLAVPILQSTVELTHLDVKPYWQWVELGSSFVFLTLLFATVYRVLSGGRIPWGYVWYGSFIAAVMFTVGKWGLSYYIVYSGTESIYGAAGSIVVFLIWVYYSSQTLFFGAELIQARRTRHEWMHDKPLAA